MGPRKSFGKKKGGKGGKGSKGGKAALKKRKQWDDYDATAAKRKHVESDDEAPSAKKPKHSGDKGGGKSSSMFGQWREKKISQRKKERQFGSKIDAKKAAQRALLAEQKRRLANAAYGGGERDSPREQRQASVENEGDSEEEEGESGEESEEEGTRGKRRSVFDQFVQVFQPSTLALEEEEEEEEDGEEEDEYEEIEVDEDGNPIEAEEEEEEEEDHTDMDAGEEMEDAVNAAEDDDEEEELQEKDGAEEIESAAYDPYRQRFLLTEFSETDAKQMDTTPRKFVPVTDHAVVPTSLLDEFHVTFRRGLANTEAATLPSLLAPSLNIRSRLLQTWRSRDVDPDAWRTASPLEFTLLQQFGSYADVFFAGQTETLTRPLRRLTAMHALNHVTKSRDTITRNNERLRKRENKDAEQQDEEEEGDKPMDLTADDEKEYRDQGFCRATVLVLMPLRSAASQFVTELLALLPPTVTMFHNKDRFFSEYGTSDGDEDAEEGEGEEQDLKEWQRVFAQGNNDDSFQIGISISRRAVRFYSDYRQADIILASPLGLRQQLGDEVVDVAETQTLSSDFLSSIEVCVLDSASLLLMQNVEHVRHVLQALNVKPKEAPHADFARLREWNLSFLGAYFRQTIVLAHGVEPMLQNLVTKCCRNHTGVVKYVRNYDSHTRESSPAITRVVPQIKQIFQRMDLSSGRALTLSPAEEVELRFEYFQKHIFTPLLDNPRRHVLIFVPSYFDYVRIRNLFHDTMNEKLIRAVQCCEYTTPKQVSRARTSFFHGRCHVMLFTERFHFYHQYQMRGIHQIVWYGLPVMGDFYAEMLNMLEDTKQNDTVQDENKSSIALYTRHDLFRLQRIVGGKRADRMCQSNAKKATFLFC
jgi:U3 small nucleolar RNA-associated protein 25